jgi:hypothetical protein
MQLPQMTIDQQQARLLELPSLISVPSNQVTAFRAEKRNLERRIDGLEAASHTSALSMEDFKALKNADDRKAYLRMRLEVNENWQKMQSRLESLSASIDKYNVQKGLLEDEHQSLRAVLQSYYAKQIEEAITDNALARVRHSVA